ncbi:hypothetical protein ACLBTR_03435, partial [Pseudomonas aeruginosa]
GGGDGDGQVRRVALDRVLFFLTIASATSFILLAGQPDTWKMVAGLVFGGLFAAPFAALLCKKLSPRTLLVIVGTLITLISAYNIYIGLR